MTILATGSSGTVGRFFPESVIPLEIDLTSEIEEFEQLELGKSDILVHAAAVVGPSVVDKDSQAARAVNIEGTRKLGLAALAKGVAKFVYVSSSHVYRFGPDFLTEGDEVSPVNEYALQKYEGEKTLMEIFSKEPEKLCILRVFSILDWGMPEYSLGGAVEKLANRTPGFALQNTDDVRDFLSPKQIANAIYEISKIGEASGVLNLCSGHPISVAEAVRRLFDLENIELDEKAIKGGNSKVSRIVGSNSKLLGLAPNLNLEWKPSSRLSEEKRS